MNTAAPLAACAHCGLPAPAGATWCCSGCEIAARIVAEAREDHATLYGRLAFALVLSMIVMMLALFLYAEDVFPSAADVELAWMRSAYRWASWILATPVLVLAGGPLAHRAIAQLRAGKASMDALIALGAFAAYGLSVDAILRGRPGIYFDTATAAVVLATFGRWMEATARTHASASLGPLLDATRGTVRCRTGDGDVREVAPAEIEPGMRLEIDVDRVVPADLRLDDGTAEVDLAVLSGESRPVVLRRGATVPAGAVPVAASLTGIALRAARDSTFERLAALARHFAERPSDAQRWADRFAAILTPAVCVLAVGTAVGWAIAGDARRGVLAALAVVLSACPCTYAIASPLVHWLTLRRAFARGAVIRHAAALEEVARTRTVAFDKTGTLTDRLTVTNLHLDPDADRSEVLGLVRALEDGSTHPVARALREYAAGNTPAVLHDRRFVPGSGVLAVDAAGRPVALGAGSHERIELRRDGQRLATFDLQEELRAEAAPAVRELRALGVRVVLLSGDASRRTARVADALGIESHAPLAPHEKVEHLEALGPGTAMVGDGMNDAPALARQPTSFALPGGADLARGVAQVTLLEADLRLVPWTIAAARRGMRTVRWLILGSTIYNVAFVALAAAGALAPVLAGLSMLVSSLAALGVAAAAGRDMNPGVAPRLQFQEQASC